MRKRKSGNYHRASKLLSLTLKLVPTTTKTFGEKRKEKERKKEKVTFIEPTEWNFNKNLKPLASRRKLRLQVSKQLLIGTAIGDGQVFARAIRLPCMFQIIQVRRATRGVVSTMAWTRSFMVAVTSRWLLYLSDCYAFTWVLKEDHLFKLILVALAHTSPKVDWHWSTEELKASWKSIHISATRWDHISPRLCGEQCSPAYRLSPAYSVNCPINQRPHSLWPIKAAAFDRLVHKAESLVAEEASEARLKLEIAKPASSSLLRIVNQVNEMGEWMN